MHNKSNVATCVAVRCVSQSPSSCPILSGQLSQVFLPPSPLPPPITVFESVARTKPLSIYLLSISTESFFVFHVLPNLTENTFYHLKCLRLEKYVSECNCTGANPNYT